MKRELDVLLRKMKEKKISVYVIPTCDYHDSEYIGEYFEFRKYVSGFTGSAGTLVVSEKESALFTDGRYFIQADRQLQGSGIRLMKMGEPGVMSVNEYIASLLSPGSTLALDGRCISYRLGLKLAEIARHAGADFMSDVDLAQEVWEGRPKQEFRSVWFLKKEEAGTLRREKIAAIRKTMVKAHAQFHIITNLDDIAWIYNMRGSDIECNPVAYAYSVISSEQSLLYMNIDSVSEDMKKELEEEGVELRPYEQIYTDILKLNNSKVMLDTSRVNYFLGATLAKYNQMIDEHNPHSTYFKAIKNQTEILNTKQVHLEDGVAVTRFMYWLKKNSLKKEIHEEDAATYIDHLRSQISDYLELSFDTISAYGENAAMMHYNASQGNNAKLRNGNFLLVDSGGQYKRGTTDITRTFAIGEVTSEMKKDFTLVVKAMLRLMNTRFMEGCTGINLDIMARGVLWQEGLDYKCGTGHGVGHILNVHEGPNAFRWKVRQEDVAVVLKEGMITTDEPGIYKEGKYGIRIENELLCKKWTENADGVFLEFEPITFAPIDLDAIDITYLQPSEIEMLNKYHKEVYEKISPYLEDDEKEFLKKYTRSLT